MKDPRPTSASEQIFRLVAERHNLHLFSAGSDYYYIPLQEFTVRIRNLPSEMTVPSVAVFSNDLCWLDESPLRRNGVDFLKFIRYQEPEFNFTDPD